MGTRDPEHLARKAQRVAAHDARRRAHGEEDLRGTAVNEVDRDLRA
jgi:hypothetical protein